MDYVIFSKDVFEITDFTTASDFERLAVLIESVEYFDLFVLLCRFIARFEDVIQEWRLSRFTPETVCPKVS